MTFVRNTNQLSRRNPLYRMTYPACHGSSLESTYLNTILTTTYWLQIISAIVKKLSNQTSGHVINLLKTIFAEYGIPAVVYTDQGTQFASEEFRAFAVQYRFQVQHSSPRYPQSNGFIEAMVKTAKNIMEKAEESGSDPHLAMLIYRSTPIRPGQLRPAELLTQRKYRALLPIHQYLHPNLENSREAQIAQKQTQADYYNQKAKELQDLKQDQSVRVQLDPNKPAW